MPRFIQFETVSNKVCYINPAYVSDIYPDGQKENETLIGLAYNEGTEGAYAKVKGDIHTIVGMLEINEDIKS